MVWGNDGLARDGEAVNWDNSKYFTREEFGTGEPGVEPDPELVWLLNAAREFAKIPFVITSGLRTEEHNARVGGVPGSAHVAGKAVDIACPNSAARFKIVDSLLASGARRIGISGKGNFVHIDVDHSKPQNLIWTY